MSQFTDPRPNASSPSSSDNQPNPFAGSEGLNQPAIPGMEFGNASRQGINSSVIAMGLVVLVGAGLVFAMRKIGVQGVAASTIIAADLDLDKVRSADAFEHKKLVSDLKASRVDRQVDVDNLRRNPFTMPEAVQEVRRKREQEEKDRRAATADPHNQMHQFQAAANGNDKEAARKQAIATEAAGLTLQSVVAGNVFLARINGQVYRVGDQVGEFFVIMDMDGRSVTLTADGQIYVLTMD
jgi:threonine dehydrogenase-like Zn-dependent dehydrogenase